MNEYYWNFFHRCRGKRFNNPYQLLKFLGKDLYERGFPEESYFKLLELFMVKNNDIKQKFGNLEWESYKYIAPCINYI
jgi:hypothetical protein